MVETLQVVLFVMLFIVLVFFVVLGVQVFFLIADVRKTITKANQVLDTTSSLTESISEPLSAISGIAGTIGTGALVAKVLKTAVKVLAKSDKEDK